MLQLSSPSKALRERENENRDVESMSKICIVIGERMVVFKVRGEERGGEIPSLGP
jgi:hypothetical protein